MFQEYGVVIPISILDEDNTTLRSLVGLIRSGGVGGGGDGAIPRWAEVSVAANVEAERTARSEAMHRETLDRFVVVVVVEKRETGSLLLLLLLRNARQVRCFCCCVFLARGVLNLRGCRVGQSVLCILSIALIPLMLFIRLIPLVLFILLTYGR